MEKVISCYGNQKKAGGSRISFRQNRLQNKEDYQGKRGALLNDIKVILQGDSTVFSVFASNNRGSA